MGYTSPHLLQILNPGAWDRKSEHPELQVALLMVLSYQRILVVKPMLDLVGMHHTLPRQKAVAGLGEVEGATVQLQGITKDIGGIGTHKPLDELMGIGEGGTVHALIIVHEKDGLLEGGKDLGFHACYPRRVLDLSSPLEVAPSVGKGPDEVAIREDFHFGEKVARVGEGRLDLFKQLLGRIKGQVVAEHARGESLTHVLSLAPRLAIGKAVARDFTDALDDVDLAYLAIQRSDSHLVESIRTHHGDTNRLHLERTQDGRGAGAENGQKQLALLIRVHIDDLFGGDDDGIAVGGVHVVVSLWGLL